MKTFRPFEFNYEIKPVEKKGIIQQDNNFIEAGEVITLPKVHSNRLKVGDVIFFESYGCYKTTDQVDGTIHYVVVDDYNIIKGIYG